jgi:hypothetical protein
LLLEDTDLPLVGLRRLAEPANRLQRRNRRQIPGCGTKIQATEAFTRLIGAGYHRPSSEKRLT